MPDPDKDDPNFGDGKPEHDIDQAEQESPEDREKRERRAKIAAHPHTQLRGILSDLSSPAARSSDITTKYATLHSAVVRLCQQILQHTPPPDDSEEQINEDFRQREYAEGTNEQVT